MYKELKMTHKLYLVIFESIVELIHINNVCMCMYVQCHVFFKRTA